MYLFLHWVNLLSGESSSAPYLRMPDISTDGSQVAFSYSGDIWLADVGTGDARPLTTGSGFNENPCFSPDGCWLAFNSSRTGNGDIYLLNLQTGDVQRLTHHDSGCIVQCWSPDGKWIYFGSAYNGLGTASYRISVQQRVPIRLGADPMESHYNLAISPDGEMLAFNNNGDQWWRHGPNHASSSEIWIASAQVGAEDHRKLPTPPGRNMWPMWAPDGEQLVFVSDRDGQENLWVQPIEGGGDAEKVTQFDSGRVLRPSIGGKWVVFERNFQIWRLDLETRDTEPLAIKVVGDLKQPEQQHVSYNGNVSQFALSPDGKKIGFVVRGEVFAISAEKGTEKGRPAFRATETTAREDQLAWNPDSKQVVYISDRSGVNQVYLYDFMERKETQLTSEPDKKALPKFSPDGKWIAYFAGNSEIRLMNAETREEKPFIRGRFWGVLPPSDYVWSPDSKWIAFSATDDRYFGNLHVQHLDWDESRSITFLSHIHAGRILWSPDGKYIIFDTTQYRTETQIARVDLIPIPPELREDEFDKLFEEKKEDDEKKEEPESREASPAEPVSQSENEADEESKEEDDSKEKKEPEPVEIEFEDIKHRLRFLTDHKLGASGRQISPDSKSFIYYAPSANRQWNLWVVSFDPDKMGDPPKQLTTSSGGKGHVQFMPDGKKFYFTDSGKIHYRDFPDGEPKALETQVSFDVDVQAEKMQMFREAWTYLRDDFYDPDLHGADWEEVRRQIEPMIERAQTRTEFHELLNLMLGELNASHLGAGGGGSGVHNACLGVEFDQALLEQTGCYKVTSILPEGPAALAKEPIQVGDTILGVDGTELAPYMNIHRQLYRKAGRRTYLRIKADSPEAEAREVILQPISVGAHGELRRRDWIRSNTRYVHEKSGGRLGYAHIREMSHEAYVKFMVDLDTETHSKEGVVVDVRFNGGGHIEPFIIDVIRRKTYTLSTYRRHESVPSATMAGNYVLDKPTILVQNEHSGSNTEMFSESYRQLGLGKIVGKPTAGAVIWTWGWSLLDGTSVRLPRLKVSTVDGENLEGRGRPVDFDVDRPLGEAAQGRDSQLDLAIEKLIEQIDSQNDNE